MELWTPQHPAQQEEEASGSLRKQERQESLWWRWDGDSTFLLKRQTWQTVRLIIQESTVALTEVTSHEHLRWTPSLDGCKVNTSQELRVKCRLPFRSFTGKRKIPRALRNFRRHFSTENMKCWSSNSLYPLICVLESLAWETKFFLPCLHILHSWLLQGGCQGKGDSGRVADFPQWERETEMWWELETQEISHHPERWAQIQTCAGGGEEIRLPLDSQDCPGDPRKEKRKGTQTRGRLFREIF